MFIALITSLMLFVTSVMPPVVAVQGRNSIEGRITNREGTGMNNMRVFLLNDSYGQRDQAYTDGSGRYRFRNLPIGNYYIQVEPGGTGYARQTGTADDGIPGAEGVVFAQAVPPNAKEAFHQAEQSIKKNDLKAAEVNLTQAIKLFPDYYEALELLGSEYVRHDYFDAAAPLLAHAVEINKNAWYSFYGLGVSLIELGRRSEGLDSLRRAVTLNPKSINANMRLGLELARDDAHADEAIKLLTTVTQLAGKKLPDAYLALASLHTRKKEYREAADALDQYLRSSPTNEHRDDIQRKINELRQKQTKSKDNIKQD
jgi:tetratricopeptide (TPR) repeat protein